MDVTNTGLLPALLAFQAEAPTLAKDARNPHFKSKYTPLDTIVETVGPLLAKHGLIWATFPCQDEHGPALRYVLGHAASGESMEGTMPLLLSKSDPQGQGSAITYARRYSLCAVLNLVADEDDDGNAASSGKAPRVNKPAAKPPKVADGDAVDAPTLAKLRAAVKAAGWTPDKLKWTLVELGVEDADDLKAAMAGLTLEQALFLQERVEKGDK